ncbi:MAG: GAF domain-containing protein [Crocinitomicaceae bacterium]
MESHDSLNLPVPNNENERLKALYYYDILDSEEEEQFNNLTELIAEICQVPIALVSFLEEERQWFKSKVGTDQTEAVRETSFCQYCIMEEKVMEVPDATKDKRFSNNPLVVNDPNLTFYAGYPLVDKDGFAIGTLCVYDVKPNKLNNSQLKALEILSKEVMLAIESKKTITQITQYKKFFNLAIDYLCIANTDGFFKEVNPTFSEKLGYTNEEILSTKYMDFVHRKDKYRVLLEFHNLKKGHKIVDFQVRFKKKDKSFMWMYWSIQPDPMTGEIFATAHDITIIKENEELLEKAKKYLSENGSLGDTVDQNIKNLLDLKEKLDEDEFEVD